jgi:DNA-directed RNA polymerase specialized sigma24 family protein
MNGKEYQGTVLEGLEDRIKGAACNVAQSWGADADDVEQEMVLAILERYEEEPEFLQQTDAYVVNYGAWKARDVLKHEACQFNREVEDSPVEDDDGITLLDLADQQDPWAEISVSLAVREAIENLDDTNRQIALGLAAGYAVPEIADEIGMTRQAVYYHMRNHISDTLGGYLGN